MVIKNIPGVYYILTVNNNQLACGEFIEHPVGVINNIEEITEEYEEKIIKYYKNIYKWNDCRIEIIQLNELNIKLYK